MKESKAVRRVTVRAFGGPEQLRVETMAEAPRVAPGQLLVEVEACGINYLDIYQRYGRYTPPLPYTPGFEGVGIVREVVGGADYMPKTLRVGQRVAWIHIFGSYASQVVLPAAQAIPVPDEFTTAEALMFQSLTAQFLVTEYRDVRPGDRILVHSAAGGVGLLLVQWFKHLGAWVVGTTSSDTKAATARAAGADAVINYGHNYAFLDELISLTDGRGVDLAIDGVGKATLESTLKGLARSATAACIGSASGAPPAIHPDQLVEKGLRLASGSVFTYTADAAELQRRAGTVIEAIRAGWLHLDKGKPYPLEQASEAHRDLESRKTQASCT